MKKKPGAQNAARPHKNVLQIAGAKAIARIEKELITAALRNNDWNRRAAARSLDMSYRSMMYKLKEYHIDIPPITLEQRRRREKIVTHRPPKIDASLLLPSPTERSLLLDDVRRGNMDISAIASDYGLTVEAVRAIVEQEEKKEA